MELTITNDNTSAGSSGSLKLLDMPCSPAIEEYKSEIIIESTQTAIEEGQVYQDKQTVAAGMKHFSVMHKFQFRVKRSSNRSYWLVCVGENCKWHFKAMSINEYAIFKIRSFNRQHTCSLIDETFIQRNHTAAVVGSMVIPKYCDPKTVYTPKDIQTDMLSEHGVNLSYMQVWRAKEKALRFLRGNSADSYSKLPKYFYILEETYPGSVVKLKKTADECFLYAFVALCTSISGWQHCRPVVVVDETFLKSAYRGIILTASTMHEVGTILPLTYVVVDSENDASWKWFFEQFKQAYGERPSMCVVSDRNESILKVRASTDHIHTVLHALRHMNETYENHCSPYYTRESLLRTYEIPVNPLHPPTGDKRQPGRPQKERYKTYDAIKSKKYKVSCGNYGGEGHNKRSCKNAPKKKLISCS
uniref:Protein FAR1-RELATED SEQUENCE 5-like n=1 Tax=Nicotiana tabacum TaxID=4097 RepID=A0A1S3YEG3_TOBAC|nr:PREDICTED: uncharacterized protein LOC107775321 [Nicotiana tabacum]